MPLLKKNTLSDQFSLHPSLFYFFYCALEGTRDKSMFFFFVFFFCAYEVWNGPLLCHEKLQSCNSSPWTPPPLPPPSSRSRVCRLARAKQWEAVEMNQCVGRVLPSALIRWWSETSAEQRRNYTNTYRQAINAVNRWYQTAGCSERKVTGKLIEERINDNKNRCEGRYSVQRMMKSSELLRKEDISMMHHAHTRTYFIQHSLLCAKPPTICFMLAWDLHSVVRLNRFAQMCWKLKAFSN